MPPYIREIEASSLSLSNSGRSLGKRYDSVSAAAAEKVECPDVYEGKFGRPMSVLSPGSSCDGRGL
jgi:hypothetical protein